MTTESQIVALMDEANPVPDLDKYQVNEVDVAAYLATLERRSQKMTSTDTRPTTEKQPKRSMTLRLATLLLVVVAGVIAILLSQSDGDAPVATDPTPSTSDESALLAAYAAAQNGGDVDTVMGLFGFNYPVKRHPFAVNDYMDSSTELRATEALIAGIRGSGAGLEFFDIEIGDPNSVTAPDVTFSWRFYYAADGTTPSGWFWERDGAPEVPQGEAGCIGGRDGKAWVQAGRFHEFNWGFYDPAMCGE
ncbi:MAG: hypothetical protein R3258_00850 [Acidimicrobiia bacterium]|nr:hypothetical protein [Acidimicrobiia bacterium]